MLEKIFFCFSIINSLYTSGRPKRIAVWPCHGHPSSCHILFLPPFFPRTFHAWAVGAEAEAELGVEAVGVLHLVELLFAVGCEEASVHGVFPSALEGEGEAFRHAPVVVEAGA